MRIDILTACPELLESPLNHSIVQRAKDRGLVEIYVHNLRDFTLDKHRKIDDYAFGFGAGMVLQIEPIDRAISFLKSLYAERGEYLVDEGEYHHLMWSLQRCGSASA